MTALDTVLVANRGEIACRIIESARREGYRTVAVFSDADAEARHVQLADTAVHIGPAAAADSYLNAARLLEAAALAGADAIHPGYGFLSENAAFARACREAGLVFIGPSAEAIEAMGNKAESKRRMLAAGVPCVPGYQSPEQGDEVLLAAAADIGFPIMVKAAAGGGGRGMRWVACAEALPAALAAARSEAAAAFGSDELILEKAVVDARHVEIQVFGDSHGNLIHLGERDCSVQRRHQKVIEECPCPVMTATLREAMGQAAVDAALSIGYEGAGTVEFLLGADGAFYFLEMNTRLQVEHPVTEMVTGLDLVALQLAVARGEPLPLNQRDVSLTGHAIEVRLYAEDPSNDFLPAAGRALRWEPPVGEGVRADHGLLPGQAISPFYDPMVAKIIAWGANRAEALRRLRRALDNTLLLGVETNLGFLQAALAQPMFVAGAATTGFIEQAFPGGYVTDPPTEEDCVIAACLQHREAVRAAETLRHSGAARLQGFTGHRQIAGDYRYRVGDREISLAVSQTGVSCYQVTDGGAQWTVGIVAEGDRGDARVKLGRVIYPVRYAIADAASVSLQCGGKSVVLVNQVATV
ncbi:MAG: acetyl-CoA carboxylase biotin carboxylase subunit, partial [Halieaceae bacterium]|nr:acetyl-CoA carboxylase biotin carboxylase subunit [Halieaceae bacterium]